MNPIVYNSNRHVSSPIIVSLDYKEEKTVMELVAKLSPHLCKLKVGSELFTACGPKIVEKLIVSGFDVFLDLKFHDIPNTVYQACVAAANMGVWMLNVHTSGGQQMLEYARKAIDSVSHKPLLIAVTVLTSISETDFLQLKIPLSLVDYIKHLANLSYQCGIDGVVCSAQESTLVKQYTSEHFLTITPGIRLANQASNDQARITTPSVAIANKADFLVIGRSITNAPDPQKQLLNILAEISCIDNNHSES